MKNVKIKLKSTIISPDGDKESNVFTYDGQYDIKNEKYYIAYDETEQNTHTIVKVDNGSAVISRTGAMQSTMKIIENSETNMPYHTPHGVFDMLVCGISVDNHLDDKKQLLLEYTIGTSQGVIGHNIIEITLEEV